MRYRIYVEMTVLSFYCAVHEEPELTSEPVVDELESEAGYENERIRETSQFQVTLRPLPQGAHRALCGSRHFGES